MKSRLFRIGIGLPMLIAISLALLAATAPGRKALPPTDSKSPTTSSSDSKDDVYGLVVALHPFGFAPRELHVAKGQYLFIVQNRSGVRDLSFALDRETGGLHHEVRNQKLQWKQQFDLTPGTYVLSVAEYPEWQSIITVDAK